MNKTDLIPFYGRKVFLTCKDGSKVSGVFSIYTSTEDNEPDPGSICLESSAGLVEIFVADIERIQLSK